MSDCPAEEHLLEFLRGDASDVICMHVETCENCTTRLADLTEQNDIEDLRPIIDALDDSTWRTRSGLKKSGGNEATTDNRIGPTELDSASRDDENQLAVSLESLEKIKQIPALAKEAVAAQLSSDEFDYPPTIGPYEILLIQSRTDSWVEYVAVHPDNQTDCWLRVLGDGENDDSNRIEQVLSHLKQAQEVESPALVKILDTFEFDGRLAVAVERVPNPELTKDIQKNGALPVGNACKLARGLAIGLQALHRTNLTHGAVGLEHLRLTTSESVKLDGFEKGAWLNPSASQSSDICALAEVLAFLLTGKKRFEGESWLDLIRLHQENAAAEDSDRSLLPQSVVDLVAELIDCDDKDPHHQISIEAVINKLETLDLSVPSEAALSSTNQSVSRGVQRAFVIGIMVVALLAIAIAVAIQSFSEG